MCRFITATLPSHANEQRLRPIIEKYGLAFAPLRNRFLEPQLAPGERYFHATRGLCDCDSPLRKRPVSGRNTRNLARKLEQFQRRGWSQTKMAQWLAQRRQHEATTAHADTHQESSVTLSLPAWIAFMSEALMSGQTTYIGLLLHMYSRSTYDEAFTLQSRELITLASLGEGARRGFCDDVLYEIHG